MILTLEQLKAFCAATDQSAWMAEPFSVRRFTYASSRSVALRVARIEEVAEVAKGRVVERLFKFGYPRQRVKFVAIPKLPKEKDQLATIGEYCCKASALRLVATLPNVRVGIPRDRDELPVGQRMIGFCFGEGQGWTAEGIGLIAAWGPESEGAQ